MRRKLLRLQRLGKKPSKTRDVSAAKVFAGGLPTNKAYRQPSQTMRDWSWKPKAKGWRCQRQIEVASA